MRFAIVVLVTLGLVVAAVGNPLVRPCPSVCTFDYKPVCAVLYGEYKTYPNECNLNMTICRTRQPWRVVAKCECVDERGPRPGSYVPGFNGTGGGNSDIRSSQ